MRTYFTQFPTWKGGFARSKDESQFPSLWDGLIFAVAPSLGATGLDLHDLSGYGTGAALTNMTLSTAWTVGNGSMQRGNFRGHSLLFDGTDDRVVMAGGAGSIWDLAGETITVAGWGAPTVAQSSVGGRFLSKSSTTNNDDYAIISATFGAPAADVWSARIRTSAGLAFINVTGDKFPFDGTWHHLALTYDGANMRFYIDGQEEASTVQTGTLTNGGATEFYLGINKGLTSRFYQGHIGDARVYNRVLTRREIALDSQIPLAMYRLRRPTGVRLLGWGQLLSTARNRLVLAS